MKHEEEKKAESGPGSVQRSEGSGEEAKLRKLRQEVEGVRRGHATGGYCDTEALQEKEKQLHGILAKRLDAAKAKHGYSPDPKFKHAEIRALELELNGLSWKPRLVVAEQQS